MKKESGFDVPGALLSFVCSLSFMYGVSMGKEAGWTSHQITGSFIIAALSLYAFIYWEGKAAYPLLDLSLFRNMEFTYGNMAGGLAFAYLAGNNFLMPFYLMLVKGMKAQQAGMMFMIYSVLYMIIGPLAGKTTNRISPRLLCSAAMALCSLNALVLAGAIRLDTIVLVVLYFIFMAFSFGVFCTSNNTVVMGMAPAGKQGIVSGTYRMVNRLGMAIGVCFFETAFTLFTSSTGSHVTGNYASLPREILIKGFQGAYVAGSIVCMLAFLTSMLARAREKGKAD
jgi:MFS family permease